MGKRVGTHRSDRRYLDDWGQEWASELESSVYHELRTGQQITVRRCSTEEGDTFEYITPIRSGICLACKSGEVAQQRTYTPDLFCSSKKKSRGHRLQYFIEVKGHWPRKERNLFRKVLQSNKGVDFRVVLSPNSAYRSATSKLNLLEYVITYMKVPVHVWNGRLPDDWY